MSASPQAAGVGSSTLREAFSAGAEAAGQATAALGGAQPALVLAFGTTGYPQQALLDGIRSVTGQAPVSGCSGEGIITRAGSDERSHAVTVMALAPPGLAVRTAFAEHASLDPRAAARSLAAQLEGAEADGGVLLLFADGVTFDCGALLRELDACLGLPVRLVGGTAGTQLANFTDWVTWQYHLGRAHRDGVAAVLLGGAVEADVGVGHGCEAMGVEFTVTRGSGAMVSELDGRPAFQVLKEFLDGDATDLSGNDDLHLVVGVPSDPAAADGGGELLLRAPIRSDPATGAIFFNGGDLVEGRRIQLVRRDVEQMRSGATATAQALAARHPGQAPLAVLQFECTGRGRVLCGDQTTAITVTPLLEAFPATVPWAGFHTFGEIAPRRTGGSAYHACAVVLCALYPRPERR